MGNVKFVEGIFVKRQKTHYGEMLKLSFNVEEFDKFLKGDGKQFINTAQNGKRYLNVDIKTGRDGSPYMAVDTWKPQMENASNQAQDDIPEDVPF